MKQRCPRLLILLTAAIGLAGCAETGGPVFGDWHGTQPAGDGLYPSYVDLVLHGAPGATQGEYDFKANVLEPTIGQTGQRTLVWGDRWTLARSPNAGSVQILDLHNLPASQISRYALLSGDVLVPLNSAGQPDTSRYSLHYALVPVPRTSRAFGRL